MALTVVKRTDDVWGFIVLPKRRLVERSLVALMEQLGVALAAPGRATAATARPAWM
ncbi:hypothetical protein ACFOZ0_02150 [Streptomyces yaanensis]|uniref:Transposase n=1 Tax=Streptomyces yaanensis TaxID=1142239 RepID=A0ABV7S6W4_9ACTN|nr:hypothetical protein [Streptomyces sp. CGMCC 4.7035]WNB99690.1 hypothetical protein Q2K21_17365 [Streptomyces sp. CGMCC 4.7035]